MKYLYDSEGYVEMSWDAVGVSTPSTGTTSMSSTFIIPNWVSDP
jgi:hypothetical protein